MDQHGQVALNEAVRLENAIFICPQFHDLITETFDFFRNFAQSAHFCLYFDQLRGINLEAVTYLGELGMALLVDVFFHLFN